MALTQEQFEQLKTNLRTTVPKQTPETGGFNVGEFATGFTKSVLGTARNVAGGIQDVGQRVLAGVTPGKSLEDIKQKTGIKSISNQTREGQQIREILTPQTPVEETGALVSEIAQFLAPSSAVVRGQKAIGSLIGGTGKLSRVGRLATKSGTEAGFGGGLTALQRGDIDDRDVKSVAIISSMFPVAGAALRPATEVLGKGLTKSGQKIQTTVLKPGKREIEQGFKVENISKYNLGGSLEQTLGKSEALMNKLSKQLNKVMVDSPKLVDLRKVYKETERQVLKEAKKQFGDNTRIGGGLEKLQQEISFVAPQGKLKVPDANTVKRAAGKKGAWVFGNTDPDASVNEIIYNKFYSILRKSIEEAAPEVANINKQLSEIIPIQNAAIKRLPVEQRNQTFGLLDTIGLVGSVFDPKALGIIGANRLSKSGRFGNLLIEASKKLQVPETRNSILERYLGSLDDSGKSFNQAKSSTIGKILGKDIPNKQGGFVKIGKSDDLIKEAKKYKSAEEFVKAQGTPVYRGTATPQSGELKVANTYGLAYGKGAYFAGNKNFAKSYGDNLMEYQLKMKNPLIMDEAVPDSLIAKAKKDLPQYADDFEKGMMGEDFHGVIGNADEANEYLQSIGIDGLMNASGKGYTSQHIVFDPSQIKTKSQLEQIWKEANKK